MYSFWAFFLLSADTTQNTQGVHAKYHMKLEKQALIGVLFTSEHSSQNYLKLVSSNQKPCEIISNLYV